MWSAAGRRTLPRTFQVTVQTPTGKRQLFHSCAVTRDHQHYAPSTSFRAGRSVGKRGRNLIAAAENPCHTSETRDTTNLSSASAVKSLTSSVVGDDDLSLDHRAIAFEERCPHPAFIAKSTHSFRWQRQHHNYARLQCDVVFFRHQCFSSTARGGSQQPEQEGAVRKKEQQGAEIKGSEVSPVGATDADVTDALSGRKAGRVNRPIRKIIVVDRNKDMYQQVRRMQAKQKERARQKTATNVYRALCGNLVISAAKLGAWASSGSSGMWAEFIHSLVDSGNQALLLMGLRDSRMGADRKHPYGYGKSVYFWALVSALGTFFLGAGVSMSHAVNELTHPHLQQITWEVWGVLVFSLAVDGYVLNKTVSESLQDKPKDVSYWNHFTKIRDPAVLAVLLEDGAACFGVFLAFGGIAASYATANPVFDGIAGVGISALLGSMGIALARMNYRFLLGQAVDREIIDDIERILLSCRSIDSIRSVQSQWTGPDTFSYKAEVDFDGTYLAAKLMHIYQQEFLTIRELMDKELQVSLALFAEDVMRTVEREVRYIEAKIRQQYPGAEYIELEPMSTDVDRIAIVDHLVSDLRRIESDALNRYLKSLKKEEASTKPPQGDSNVPPADR